MSALTVEQWIGVLAPRLQRQAAVAQQWDAYYDGRQPLSYLAPELLRELDGRIRAVVVNWPRLVVDSVDERLDVEGFRYGTDDAGDDRLWSWWQANDLDEGSQMAHVDALATGTSFVSVGSGDAGVPVVTVESSEQVTVDCDPRTRAVRAAWKAWRDDVEGVEHATLYLPEATAWYSRPVAPGSPAGTGWVLQDSDRHGLGVVPVVPVANRPRTLAPLGQSELVDVVPLSDAACKVATDMMVAAEFHAMPRRWVVGMTEADFTDAQGNQVGEWSRVAGRLWATGALPSEVQMGQFAEASLSNFHDTINALARLVASLAGLPPHQLGMTTDNPASADAIRSSETRLVKRAERRQRSFGGSWESVMRLCLLIVDGEVPEEARALTTVWRDAATPTIAQKADAAVKLYAGGITSRRQAREDVGYSETQIKRMAADDQQAASDQLTADLVGAFGAAGVPAGG